MQTCILGLLALLASGVSAKQKTPSEFFTRVIRPKPKAICTAGGDPCVFPFKFRNREFNTCTTSDGDARPWCATQVTSTGGMQVWKYCDSNCPGVIAASTMYVHPENAVGNCKCGVPNVMAATRIVGGVETQIGEYPWQVGLIYNSQFTESQGCGGTLVSDRYVITAAHCTANLSPSQINILIGDTNLAVANDTTRFISTLSEIRQHPQYNPRTLENDISVLVLSSPIDLYSYPNIKPACLPTTETVDDLIGENAVVSGWGTVGSGLHQNSHLHEVTVKVLGKSNCGSHTSGMTPDMFCAGLLEGGKDSCQGDSGGPLVAKNENDNNGAATLVGVVSWGYGCAAVNAPGVYSDVSNYVQNGWLNSQLSGINTCSPPTSSDWSLGSSSIPSTTAPSTTASTTTPTPTPSTTASTTTPTPTPSTAPSTTAPPPAPSTTPAPTTGSGSQCTAGGDPCVFPFKFRNREFSTCTTSDGDAKPWCATQVSSTGNMVTWKYCDSNCPGVTAVNTMYIHPDNAVGSCNCGVPNTLAATRIVGGVETEIGEYPWQVGLLYNGQLTESQGCGGTLVSDRYVITAAHCTANLSPSQINILIGDTNLAVANDTTRFISSLSEIRQHPQYNPSNLENDISVLVLSSPIDLYSYPNIKPACLPTTETVDDLIGENAVVSGWGTVGSGLHQNSHLHEVTVEVLGKTNCGAHTSGMTPDMFCAGLLQGGKDSCQGDSGGPLVAKNENDNNGAATLVGVVSWGYGCADVNAPGVYSDVSNYVQNGWLNSQLSNINTCPPPSSSDWSPAGSSTPSTASTPPPFSTTSSQPSTASPSTQPPPSPSTTSSTTTTAAPTTTTAGLCYTDMSIPRLIVFKRFPRVADEATCHALCLGEPTCVYWSWKPRRNQLCRLHELGTAYNDNFTSGPRNCISIP